MSFHLTRARLHSFARGFYFAIAVTGVIVALTPAVFSQKDNKSQAQSGLTNVQRMDLMRNKLEAMRRSLENAIAAIPAKADSDKTKNADDPRTRLQGLNKEVGQVLNDVNDLHAKEDHSEKYDASKLDGLETSVADLNTRVEAGLTQTASARTAAGDQASSTYQPKREKGHRRMLGLLPGKSNDKYAELTGSVAPGRDRQLFLEATKEVRKGNHDTGRLLFTTIITTYPDSPYLPMAKLAIADSFYLEGGTSGLIQASQAYQDWLTYFPTDPLADAAMMKIAESEMRQMGLSDRDVSHARKAEQRLKALLQQYPQTKLRPEVEQRLRQVQDNLGDHSYGVADFYRQRYNGKKGGLKGAQDRYKEIIEKYPNYCRMDDVLYYYAWTFTVEEEPDEAAKYYQRLVRDHPNSPYVDKAKEQLNIIGAAIPEPDPARKAVAPCEKPGFMSNMMQQITGSANIDTSNNGILITKHGEGTDLIDKAIQNNGQISENDIRVYQQTSSQPAPAKTTPPPTKPNDSSPDPNNSARPPASPTPKP
ncbi:MAG TPA: outer membrane protein assembly factor BamD [Pyrinomonadaceae bacterium]|jgi:outer membrane protein assembly factor BamD|nr:outer membrane protein assembly factor BamD [Pyrinomonadaceae bacterium]